LNLTFKRAARALNLNIPFDRAGFALDLNLPFQRSAARAGHRGITLNRLSRKGYRRR
jgi:hypothetical protein